MERQVFRHDAIGTIGTIIILLGCLGFAVYNLIATENYLNLILIIIPLLLFIPIYKRRVVIENGTLLYKKPRISLLDVSVIYYDIATVPAFEGTKQIVTHLYFMDKAQKVLLHFDKDYATGKRKQRFLEAVKAANSDVDIQI